MSTELLRRAREYEMRYGAEIPASERPLFHAAPRVGWMNDPNGFSYYRGEYHLFYQYNPYSTAWDAACWGHCKSKDLLHWEHLPAALAPDQLYDGSGCFSGTAAAMPDGRQLLMYTGVRREPLGDGGWQEYQTQCIAVGDGLDYEKLAANPVITAAQLPPGGSIQDFRDPKIWRDGETWYAAVANRMADGSGAVVLYTSTGLTGWRFAGMLDRSDNQWGRMWECPDIFSLDGAGVLLVSAQELDAPDPVFHNGHEALCLLGSWNGRRFTRSAVLPVDQGLDFYAPQTLCTPDGRRVMLGWMQAWESSGFVPGGQRWFGQMTLPRELRVRDGLLLQCPVRELENWRRTRTAYQGIRVSGRTELPGVSGRTIDLTLRLPPQDGFSRFAIRLAQDRRHNTVLQFDPVHSELTLDRSQSGFPYHTAHRRTVPVRDQGGALALRVILDRFSVEVFVNDGEQVLSAVLYTPQAAQGISFEASGQVRMDIEQFVLAAP